MSIDRRDRIVHTVVVPNGASVSAAFPCNQGEIVGVVTPSAIDSASSITFTALGTDGSTYVNVHDEGGTEVAVTAAVSRYHVVSSGKLKGLGLVKLRLGTSGAPVTATADRTLKVIVLS